MKDDRLYVAHILECVGRIEEYSAEGEDSFFQDRKSQDAILRNLHTLTESSQRLSSGLKEMCPEVAWRSIAEFRNVVVHDYLGIDLQIIWDIVQRDLPVLKRAMQSLAERG